MTRLASPRPSGPTCAMVFALALLLVTQVSTALAEDQPASPNPLQGLDKTTLKGFRERPLFNPARTEAKASPSAAMPAADAPAPLPAAAPPSLHLVGIVSGATTLAMIRLDNASSSTLLATGDKVGDWTVTVLPAGLRLELGDRSIAFDMFAPKTAVAQPQPDAAMPAPPPGMPP